MTYPNGISVVVPNYNGVSLFPSTLPPLLAVMGESGLAYEIIISDDCSTDSSIQYLAENYPSIKVIESLQNTGFSGACNRGIKQASFDLVLLLNSDIILTENYFKSQLSYFSNPETFGVMGRIIGWYDEIIQDGARYPAFHGSKIKTSVHYLTDPVEEHILTFYVSGANALVDRKKLMQLNGFDELFAPFYVEDVDLSVRAWRMGWFCYYDYNSVCRHRTSSSIKAKSKKRFIETVYNRNKYFLHLKHLDSWALPGWWMQTIAEVVFRCLTFRFTYAKALYQVLKSLNTLKLTRQQFEKLLDDQPGKRSLKEVCFLIKENLKGKTVKWL